VKIIEGNKIMPAAYEFSTGSTKTVCPVNQITGMSAIMHKKTFNPIDSLSGLSPMTAAAYGIDILNAGSKWNLKLLQNEARPSGALIMKGKAGEPVNLSADQRRALREDLDQQISGTDRAGRPLLLEGGMEWLQMSQSAKDMDHERSMDKSAREIALVYGVPPMLLGIQGDNTYSNYEQAKLALWTDTCLPLLASMLETLNIWLAPMYGDGVELWYDEEMIPALEPLRRMKAERVEASTSMTINEKRKAMGYEAVEGGDVILVDASKIPLDLMGDMGLAEAGSAAKP
jgi:HK97 family phage portal protein